MQDLNAPRPLVKDLSLKDKRSPTEARGEFFLNIRTVFVYIFKVPLSSSLRFKLKLHFEECHSTFLLTFWIPSVIPPVTGNWNAIKIGNNSNFVAGGFLDTC